MAAGVDARPTGEFEVLPETFLLRAKRIQVQVTEIRGRLRYYSALRRLADFLDNPENFSTRISIEEAAQVAALSPSAFKTRFKAATGLCFHSFLIVEGISQAITILEKSDESITSSVGEAGFESLDSLERNFKQQLGCTPSEYRAIFLASKKKQPEPTDRE